MGCTFDGTTKIITMTAGTLTLDVRDVYSRWKDWIISTGSGYLNAFSVVGGDPVDAGQGIYVTSYFFLENGWKVKPQESSHKLTVTNGVLVTSDGSDPFVQTDGTFNVLVQYSQPVKSETVATGGGSGTDPWLTQVPGSYNAGTAGSILGNLRTYVINEGTALGGTSTSITLALTSSPISETYTNLKVVIVSGTGTGQARVINGYEGSSRIAIVDAWVTTPDTSSVYAILPYGGGVGTGGGATVEDIWEYTSRTITSKQARYDL
jgi:hypothetical protein